MLDVIRQLALDVAEAGADFCMGTVIAEEPLMIRIEEGMDLTEEFLILTEHTLDWEETGTILIEDGDWRQYRMKRNRKLLAGETVALLRAEDGQQYLVLGRVRKEG